LYHQQVDLPSVVLHRGSLRLLHCPRLLLHCPWTCQRGNHGPPQEVSSSRLKRCPSDPLNHLFFFKKTFLKFFSMMDNWIIRKNGRWPKCSK
jgi:hypothetical protein